MEHLYVAQGARGLLKVGRTQDPYARRASLLTSFKAKGDQLVHFQLCPPVKDALYAEALLICRTRDRLLSHSGREWFVGGDFNESFSQACLITRAINTRRRKNEWAVEVLRRLERKAALTA